MSRGPVGADRSKTTTLNCRPGEPPGMTEQRRAHCPECGDEHSFYQAASTEVHLGTKVKWHCPECDYAFVRIDGDVDTGEGGAGTA